jgi:hypothetical protein
MQTIQQVHDRVNSAKVELQKKLKQAAAFNSSGGHNTRIARIGAYLNNVFIPQAELIDEQYEMQDVSAAAEALYQQAKVVWEDDTDWNP